MHGDVPCPKLQRTIGIGLLGDLLRQIAILDDLSFTLKLDHVANLLGRKPFFDNLRGRLGSSQSMQTDKQRVARTDEWIVDLRIKQMLDATLLGKL